LTRIFVPSHLSNRGLGDQRNRTDLVANLARVAGIEVVALADSSVKHVSKLTLFPALNLMFAFPHIDCGIWGKLRRTLWLGYLYVLRTVFLLYCLVLMVATRSRLLFLYWPTSVEACWLSLLSKRLLSARTILWLNGHLELTTTHRVRIHYKLLRKADAVIIPSEGMWQYFLSRKRLGLASERPHIVKEDFGYISRSRSRLDLPKEQAREIIGMPLQQKIVLGCGRWQPFKGLHHIVGLAADLAKREAIILMVVSGAASSEAPDYRAAVLKQAKRFANVKLVEDVPYETIPYYMRCADLLVMASEGDNYNDTFREAIVNGLPVVAFEAGLAHLQMNRILTLVQNGDFEALRKAVLAKLNASLAPEETFQSWIQKFSTEHVASVLADRIRQIELRFSNEG
jgi:glycosyltransferase involved in cell wall biosynthesis